MVEELQLSLARWRAGEWKCGRRSGRCDRIFGRSSGLPHTVGPGRRRSSPRATPRRRAGRRERERKGGRHFELTHSLTHSLTHFTHSPCPWETGKLGI